MVVAVRWWRLRRVRLQNDGAGAGRRGDCIRDGFALFPYCTVAVPRVVTAVLCMDGFVMNEGVK